MCGFCHVADHEELDERGVNVHAEGFLGQNPELDVPAVVHVADHDVFHGTAHVVQAEAFLLFGCSVTGGPGGVPRPCLNGTCLVAEPDQAFIGRLIGHVPRRRADVRCGEAIRIVG